MFHHLGQSFQFFYLPIHRFIRFIKAKRPRWRTTGANNDQNMANCINTSYRQLPSPPAIPPYMSKEIGQGEKVKSFLDSDEKIRFNFAPLPPQPCRLE